MVQVVAARRTYKALLFGNERYEQNLTDYTQLLEYYLHYVERVWPMLVEPYSRPLIDEPKAGA